MSGLGAMALRRLLRGLVAAFFVATLVFLLLRVLPGDAAVAVLGEQASAEELARVRSMLGLDRSLAEQYARFLSSIVDGTLGTSFRRPERSVASLLAEVAPSTFALAVAAVGFATMVGLPIGIASALDRDGRFDKGVRAAVAGFSVVPLLVLGPIAIWLFSVVLPIAPLPGDDLAGPLGLVLPTITMGAALAAILVRQTRSALIDTLTEPYVVAARARGLSRRAALLRHALRNALPPIVTVLGAQLGALLGGAVIAERLFERPGLGSLFLDAFFARDLPVVEGTALAIGLTYVLVNVGVDVVQAIIDPRARPR